MNKPLKVLLLDPEWDQTVHLTAYLSSAGIDVTLVSSRPPDPFCIGAYCKQVSLNQRLEGAAMSSLFEGSDADLILPLSENLMDAAWNLPEHQTSRVFPPTNQRQRQLLQDRRQMYALTESLGIPTPRLELIAGENDIDSAIERFGLPLVLRGTQGLAGEQVRVISDRGSATEAYRMLVHRSPDRPFAQEFVEGRRCLVGGLFSAGLMVQHFAQTTLKSVTPTGPSIQIESLNDHKLIDYAQRLFRELRWTGLACAEFIRTKCGEYFFLEVNPRPWAAIQAAHCCGVPLMQSFANYLQGLPIERATFRSGTRVTLFPQFIVARLRSADGIQPRDILPGVHSLIQATWRHPRMVLYFLRRIWWALRSRQIPNRDTPPEEKFSH